MASQELNKRIENLASPRAKQVAEILTDLDRENMKSQSFSVAQVGIRGYLKNEIRVNVPGARVEDRVFKGAADGKDHLLQVVNVGEDILNVGGIQTAIESNKVEDTKKSKLREIRNDVVDAVEAVLGKDEVDRLMELSKGKELGQRGREFELRLGGRGMMSGIDKAIEAKREEEKKNNSNVVQNEEPEVVVTSGEGGVFDYGKFAEASAAATVQALKEVRLTDPSRVGGEAYRPRMDKEGGPDASYGVIEAMRRIQLPTEGLNADVVSNWSLDLTDYLGRNPLFFAGGWQQAISHVVNELELRRSDLEKFGKERAVALMAEANEIGRTDRNKAGELRKQIFEIYGLDGKKYFTEIRKSVESVLTVKIQEAALLASDDSFENWLNFIPPVENMSEFVWNKELRGKIDENPLASQVMDWVLDLAFSDNGSEVKKIVDALSSVEALDQFCLKIANNINNHPDIKQNLDSAMKEAGFDNGGGDVATMAKWARLAMSTFIVDEYPSWALWIHNSNMEYIQNGDGKWVINEDKKNWDWYENEPVDMPISGEGKESIRIMTRSSNLFGEKAKTMVKHPFLSLFAPADVLRLKGGSYGEEVIRPFEEAFEHVAGIQFIKAETGEAKRPSDINTKQIARFAKAYNAIVGDLYGSGFGDFKDIEKAVQQLQNMAPTDRQWKYNEVGYAMSLILESHLRALRQADPRSFVEILISNVGVIADSLAEEQKMLEQLAGGRNLGTSGVFHDLRAQYHLKYGTERLRKVYRGFVAGDMNHPELLSVGKTIEAAFATLAMVSGGGGKRK